MRANIRDVSKAAGVSIKTVSRVINNKRYVHFATRTRLDGGVLSLMRERRRGARADRFEC